MASNVTYGDSGEIHDYLELDPAIIKNRQTDDSLVHDYFDPAALTNQATDNKMFSGPTPNPGTPTQRPGINEPANQAVDGTPPNVVCPPDQTVTIPRNIGGTNKVYLQPCTAADDSGTVNLVSQSHQSGQFFQVGPTEVTFTFTDQHGNRASGSYIVNVVEEPTDPSRNITGTSGAVYVRWGRTTCPSVSDIVYAGLAGGKHYTHTGSGSNYLCLPEDPEYDVYNAGVDRNRGYVYSAEYSIDNFPPFADKYQHDVPCAVCRATNRGSVLMIPAKMTCPSEWTNEYHGYLMSENYVRESSTEFVCVDRDPESVPGGVADDNGILFFPVEGRCDSNPNTGNLPCTPYIDGAELTCVVCSK